MDIPNLKPTSVQVSTQSNNTVDILNSLRRLGGIDATVVRIEKGEVLLATRLGEIIGKNALDLKVGEQVRLRVGGPDSNPVLRVSQASPERILLNASRQAALLQALTPNQPQTAVVIAQKPGFTGMLLNGREYSISRQTGLKTGQSISLTYRPDQNQIEIKPANTERILKAALTRMLPQVIQAGSGDSLVSLVKSLQSLVSGLLVTGGDKPIDTRAALPGQSGARLVSPGQKSVGTGMASTRNAAQFEATGAQAQLVSRIVSMLQSLPELSTLDKGTIRQWAGYTSQAKNNPDASQLALQNPFSLLKQLPADEAGIRSLLQQLARQMQPTQRSVATSAPGSESGNFDFYSSLAKDILKLVEQSLIQQQFQQTNLRYQQEQQQPINLSLTIPLSEDQATRPLHVEIREMKSSAAEEDNSWDINLSFEFGLLGLISSHIVLEGNTLSTTFWASEQETKIKIDQALPEFKQQLVVSGFELGQFFSLAGPAPAKDRQERPYYPDALLDIRV